MRSRCVCIALACAIGASCPSRQSAYATATTHIWAPSTDVQAFNVWHIHCDLYLPAEHGASGNVVPAITDVGLTVGVLPSKKLNLELGFDHKSGLGAADRNPLYVNAKIGIPENAFCQASPALAVGAFDVGTRKGQTDFNMFYGKIAKTFSIRTFSLGRFSLGYFAGNDRLLLDQDGKKDAKGILAAWERTITEVSDKLWVCLEYMGTRSFYGSFNLGAAWKFAPNVAVIGGYDVFNNKALINTATFQVDIDI